MCLAGRSARIRLDTNRVVFPVISRWRVTTSHALKVGRLRAKAVLAPHSARARRAAGQRERMPYSARAATWEQAVYLDTCSYTRKCIVARGIYEDDTYTTHWFAAMIIMTPRTRIPDT
eukprot:6199556-Pleurochrysis_carterae.AAC.3